MFSWFKKKPPTSDHAKISIVVSEKLYNRLNIILGISAHPSLNHLVAEAFNVLSRVYAEDEEFYRSVTCRIVNGKIEMYVDGPGDGGEPIEVEDATNVIILFPKAA